MIIIPVDFILHKILIPTKYHLSSGKINLLV